MVSGRFLLLPLLLAACHQAEPAAQEQATRQPYVPESARVAFAKCLDLGAHAEVIACKDDLASKEAERVDQAFRQYEKVAARLDGQYRKAFPDQPAKPGESFAELAAASQAAWKAYAEKQCRFDESTSFGGSGGGDFATECKLRLNSQRAEELTLELELAEGSLKS